MNKKNFINVIIGIGVVIVLTAIVYVVARSKVEPPLSQNHQQNNDSNTQRNARKETNNKENSTIKREPSTDKTARWKTYRNEKYGFEIKYPDVFQITSEGMGRGKYSQEQGSCSIVYEVVFIDSMLQKKAWEGNAKTRVPSVSLRVENADCPSVFDEKYPLPEGKGELTDFQKAFPEQVSRIIGELVNMGIPRDKLLSQIFTRGISWNPSNYEPSYGCKKILLINTKDGYAVKQSKCMTGPVRPQTTAFIIPTEKYMFELYDESSDYELSGVFDKILSTFRLIK